MGQGQGKAQGEGGEQAIEDSGGRAAVVQEEVDDEGESWWCIPSVLGGSVECIGVPVHHCSARK